MYIGKAAKLSGTTVKTIRHYEDIGLLPTTERKGKYRVYTQEIVEVLRFIKCAQNLGFKLKELQAILQGYSGAEFPWEQAQREIQRKKCEILEHIDSMKRLYSSLEEFERSLHGAKEKCHLVRAVSPENDTGLTVEARVGGSARPWSNLLEDNRWSPVAAPQRTRGR